MRSASRHDFSSLSVKDLLDARDAYHVHLAHLDNVFATGIGRYLIRTDDANKDDPTLHSDRNSLGPRTLANTVLRDWSWPCVLVFVRKWFTHSEIAADPALAEDLVPSFLYLPDGRVVPTCVVLVDPDAPVAPPPPAPAVKSDIVGGGYPVWTNLQGRQHVGSVGCLVTDGSAVFALTNRHVVGEAGQPVYAGFKNTRRRLGISDRLRVGKRAFSDVYPGWPGEHAVANLDAGLIRIDDVRGWTAQVYGIGEIGPVWDLNASSFRLDVIGCPVMAHGGASGAITGKILGLFYRYKTVGGIEYVTDFLIGPRDAETPLGTLPGDSGTIWFEDLDTDKLPRNAAGAPVRRPIALEWGGQRLLAREVESCLLSLPLAFASRPFVGSSMSRSSPSGTSATPSIGVSGAT